MKKKLMALFLLLVMVFTVFPWNAVEVQAASVVASGQCGANVTWKLDSEGTLTISGTGSMEDCEYYKVYDVDRVTYSYTDSIPWRDERDAIKTVIIKKGVKSIGGFAFSNCNSLTSITIPDSVTSIGDGAFFDCDSLTSVTIPDSVTSIGDDAFAWCDSLTSVTIPDSVTSIGDYTFERCDSLTKIYVNQNNSAYSSDSRGVLFNKQKTTLIQAPRELNGKYEIPSGVTSIGDYVFFDCDRLTSVTIPDSVTSIGDGAFKWCDSLTSVTIPDSVTSIGDGAFARCDSLTEIQFCGDAPSLSKNAFYEVSATAYYPANNPTWTADVMQNYGGTITWVESKPNYNLSAHSSYDVNNIRANQEITVQFILKEDGTPRPIENCTVVISDSHVIEVTDNKRNEDGSRTVVLKGLKSGTTSITFTDMDTGESKQIEFTVEEFYSQTEWVDKHIEYANSDQYKSQIVQGFSGALNDALEDIKSNGMITAYNTLDSINNVLDFDLDLTDEQEYELLLAQILFTRTGVDSIDNIYDEFLTKDIITICEILIKHIPDMTAPEIAKQVESLKTKLDTIKKLSHGDIKYNQLLDQILNDFDTLGDFNFKKEYVEAFDKAGLKFAANFVENEIGTVENTLSQTIMYMAAGEAYCNTSDAFGEMILSLRKHIAIPSDNPIFAPYPSDKMLVTDQMIWEKLGLKNANNSIGPDPLNTPIHLSALAKAIEDYYTQLEAYKEGNASVIASYALVEFADETIDNVLDAGLDVTVSLFECIPVVKQFSVIKELFDKTQIVIDVFTDIDDRAYLGTMVMRLYGMAYLHYLSVDNLASHTDTWGMLTTSSPLGQKFDWDEQFADAVRFDESVAVYRSILSVAADYAKEYYATYYKVTNSILSKYPDSHPTIFPDTESDMFKSVKQKIVELQMQQNELAYEWCHSPKTIFEQLHGIKTYDSSELLIYSFKCPVSVTFANESGEIIATLSNGHSTVAAGYERYFYTSEVIENSGEYIKIAAVPKSYAVTIEGTGDGRMDISVSEYTDKHLGKTTQYFSIPVSQNSKGYFKVTATEQENLSLVMDERTYTEGDYSDVELDENKPVNTGRWIAVAAGGVAVILMVIIFSRKRKKQTV